MSDFKVGDVVWLKSGGPGMTIKDIENTRCHCNWFVSNKRESGTFESDQLTTENPDVLPVGSNI